MIERRMLYIKKYGRKKERGIALRLLFARYFIVEIALLPQL